MFTELWAYRLFWLKERTYCIEWSVLQKLFSMYSRSIGRGENERTMKYFFLIFAGASFGLLAAAGVFTVLTAVGLVPRFAGKTHTARKILLFEEMVILGTIVGCFVSIFPEYCQVGALLERLGLLLGWGLEKSIVQEAAAVSGLWRTIGGLLQGSFGLFAGMFVGCLALAIAEMLDSIPIFARRIGFRHGIGLAVFSVAIGKLVGSFWYFWTELHRVMQ